MNDIWFVFVRYSNDSVLEHQFISLDRAKNFFSSIFSRGDLDGAIEITISKESKL